MKSANVIKDDKLGSVLVYNFSKGYGDVPMDVYALVLPLLFNDIFRDALVETNNVASALMRCKIDNTDFYIKLLEDIKNMENFTSGSLGLCMVNKYLNFELKNEYLHGIVQDADVVFIQESFCLGDYFKSMSYQEILDVISDVSVTNIVLLDYDAIGHDIDISHLSKLGNLNVYNDIPKEDISGAISNANIVITNKKTLGENELKDAKKLELICVTATGYNTIDLNYCNRKNIKLANVVGYSTDSVAQHTFALLLSLQNKISYYHHYILSKEYSDKGLFSHFGEQINELSGKTWGIIGMGNIGRKVASIAIAFGCNIQYYSTSNTNTNQPFECVDFETLLQTSDIISIHAPLNDNTRSLINKDAFMKMKKNALIINVGRGPIIVEEDLIDALHNNLIAGAGLDVFKTEPMDANSGLLTFENKNLVMTPHVAWSAVESRTRCLVEVGLNIEAHIHGKDRNIVK